MLFGSSLRFWRLTAESSYLGGGPRVVAVVGGSLCTRPSKSFKLWREATRIQRCAFWPQLPLTHSPWQSLLSGRFSWFSCWPAHTATSCLVGAERLFLDSAGWQFSCSRRSPRTLYGAAWRRPTISQASPREST